MLLTFLCHLQKYNSWTLCPRKTSILESDLRSRHLFELKKPKTQQSRCCLQDEAQKLGEDGWCGTTNVWCAVFTSSVFSSFFSIDFIILGHGKCYWYLDCISLCFFFLSTFYYFTKKKIMFAHTWIQLSNLSVLLAQWQ